MGSEVVIHCLLQDNTSIHKVLYFLVLKKNAHCSPTYFREGNDKFQFSIDLIQLTRQLRQLQRSIILGSL